MVIAQSGIWGLQVAWDTKLLGLPLTTNKRLAEWQFFNAVTLILPP